MNQTQRMNKEQKKASKAALAFLKRDGKAFVQSATGTGKSRIILRTIKLVRDNLSNKPVLVLAHRNYLIDQLTSLFKDNGIKVSRFCADEKDLSGSVVVSSVPTLSKKEHIEKIDYDKFGLVILDEAHHAPADSFHNTLNYFSNALKLGVSATPFRPDRMQETRNHFGEIVYELSFDEAKKLKIVAKEKTFLILTDSVLNGITTVTGDYSKKALERLFTTKDRNDIIVQSYLKYGRGTMDKKGLKYKSICFCINTKHAIRMAKLFNSQGIKAAILVSDRRYLSSTEREETLNTFRNTHEIEMLCVVDIFNEGVDVPNICCALMTRPTRSNIIYQQQVGRVCRRIEGQKHYFVVLDFVDNTTQEFTCYTADNNFKKKATKANIVTEYLMVKDPVIVRKRVTDLMASVRKFEEQFAVQWTLEKCEISAKNYVHSYEWKKADPNAHQAAIRNGWFKGISEKYFRSVYADRSYDSLVKSAKKYENVGEWRKQEPRAYNSAIRKKWLSRIKKEVGFIETRKPIGYWESYDNCLKFAQECSSIEEYCHTAAGKMSRKKGFIREILRKVFPDRVRK